MLSTKLSDPTCDFLGRPAPPLSQRLSLSLSFAQHVLTSTCQKCKINLESSHKQGRSVYNTIMTSKKVQVLDLPHSRKVRFHVTPLEQGHTHNTCISPMFAIPILEAFDIQRISLSLLRKQTCPLLKSWLDDGRPLSF